MLIGFIALISGLNALFAAILGISFQGILGYIFYPIAWVMGVPSSEALQVGSIMATKLVSNEFVAMMDLQFNAGERPVRLYRGTGTVIQINRGQPRFISSPPQITATLSPLISLADSPDAFINNAHYFPVSANSPITVFTSAIFINP